MFFKQIKQRSLLKAAGKIVGERILGRKSKISSVGVISDEKCTLPDELRSRLAKGLNISEAAVHELIYKSAFDPKTSDPYFNQNSFTWRAKPKTPTLAEFLARDYDLLITYSQEQNDVIEVLVAVANARIKVGYQDSNLGINDLIIKTELSNYKGFSEELFNYLKILKIT